MLFPYECIVETIVCKIIQNWALHSIHKDENTLFKEIVYLPTTNIKDLPCPSHSYNTCTIKGHSGYYVEISASGRFRSAISYFSVCQSVFGRRAGRTLMTCFYSIILLIIIWVLFVWRWVAWSLFRVSIYYLVGYFRLKNKNIFYF